MGRERESLLFAIEKRWKKRKKGDGFHTLFYVRKNEESKDVKFFKI